MVDIAITVQRHRNTTVTSYNVSGAQLTNSERTFRLNCKEGDVVYTGGLMSILDPEMKELITPLRQLAQSIFALHGVDQSFGGPSGGSIVIKSDQINVTFDPSKVSDESLEQQVLCLLADFFGTRYSSVDISIDEYQRSEEFDQACRRSQQTDLSDELRDDADIDVPLCW